MGPNNHLIADCPQAPTINRLEGLMEQLVEALSQIARQGALVESHEKRLDKHDKDLVEVFGRIRKVELVHAHDAGVEEVTSTEKKFWEAVKVQMSQNLVLAGIFILLAFDRLNIGMVLTRLWKEIFG